MINAAVVPSPVVGYLMSWATSVQQPVVSTLNATDGSVTSNMAIVGGTTGLVDGGM